MKTYSRLVAVAVMVLSAGASSAGTIDAPAQVQACGGLVFVKGTADDGGRLAWIVLEPFGTPTVPTESGFAFAAPAKIGTVKIVLIEITDDNVGIAIHAIEVVGGQPQPPPPPPPARAEKLSTLTKDAMSKLPANLQRHAPALAKNHEDVAKAIRSGVHTTSQQAWQEIQLKNRATAGADAEALRQGFFTQLKQFMVEQYPEFPGNVSAFAEALEAVAEGLQ